MQLKQAPPLVICSTDFISSRRDISKIHLTWESFLFSCFSEPVEYYLGRSVTHYSWTVKWDISVRKLKIG